jgi:regulator-associated protein of mTOR
MSDEVELPYLNDANEEEEEAGDWNLLIAFNELRHREKIQGSKKVAQTWRMKERVCIVPFHEL